MSNDKHPEVLIAGAGPAGLFAGLQLSRHGVPLTIVDTGVWPCQHSYALALHPHSLELLGGGSLRDRLMDECYRVESVALYDRSHRRAHLRMNHGSFLAVLRQDVLEEELEKALNEFGVQVLWRHEVASLTQDGGSVDARVHRFEKDSRGYAVAHEEWVVDRTLRFDVPFVIGADGYNSLVRRSAGIAFDSVNAPAYYAVFEFSTDADLHGEMSLVFGDDTTDVLWPLPGGNCRWSFQLPDYHDPKADRFPQQYLIEREKDRVMMSEGEHSDELSVHCLQQLLKDRAPWFKGSVGNIHWRTLVRFEKRLAAGFGRGRMWLAGDAAHLTGPAGVQSMNSGIAEAWHLASAIYRMLKRNESDEVLAEYDRKWLAVWRQVQGLECPLKPSAQCDPWIASIAPRLHSAIPALGDDLVTLAAQLHLAV